MGLFFALLASISFSAANILVRRADRSPGANGEIAVVISLVVNAAVLMAAYLMWVVTRPVTPLTTRGVAVFIAAGLFTAFLARSLLFLSIQRIGPGRAIAISQAAPVVSIAMGVAFLSEQISILGGIGIAVALSGVSLFIADAYTASPPVIDAPIPADDVVLGADDEGGMGSSTGSPPARMATLALPRYRNGITLAGLAAAAFGIGHALRKQGVIEIPDPLAGAAIGTTVALAASVVVFAARSRRANYRSRSATEPHEPALSSWRIRDYWLTGLVLSVAQISFFIALVNLPVSYVSVVVASQAIWTILLAGIFFGESEQLTLRVVVSACVMLAGVALLAWA